MHNQCSGICPGPVHFANSDVAREFPYPWASKPAVRTWAQNFPSMKQNLAGGADKLRTVVSYTWFGRGKIFVFFLDVKPIPLWHMHDVLIPIHRKAQANAFFWSCMCSLGFKSRKQNLCSLWGSQLPFWFGLPDESISSWCRGKSLDGHSSISAPVWTRSLTSAFKLLCLSPWTRTEMTEHLKKAKYLLA